MQLLMHAPNSVLVSITVPLMTKHRRNAGNIVKDHTTTKLLWMTTFTYIVKNSFYALSKNTYTNQHLQIVVWVFIPMKMSYACGSQTRSVAHDIIHIYPFWKILEKCALCPISGFTNTLKKSCCPTGKPTNEFLVPSSKRKLSYRCKVNTRQFDYFQAVLRATWHWKSCCSYAISRC